MANDERPPADERRTGAENVGRTEGIGQPPELPPDATASLRRIEKLLSEIRGALDAAARAGEHREYSLGRVIGAVLQVIVGGLVVLALFDWLLGAPVDGLLVKLVFAAVLQLGALTAFVVSRGGR